MSTAVTKDKRPVAAPERRGGASAPNAKEGSYLTEVQREMRKVSWPKRNELINNTVITLVASGLFALVIFGMDRVISFILQAVYGA